MLWYWGTHCVCCVEEISSLCFLQYIIILRECFCSFIFLYQQILLSEPICRQTLYQQNRHCAKCNLFSTLSVKFIQFIAMKCKKQLILTRQFVTKCYFLYSFMNLIITVLLICTYSAHQNSGDNHYNTISYEM